MKNAKEARFEFPFKCPEKKAKQAFIEAGGGETQFKFISDFFQSSHLKAEVNTWGLWPVLIIMYFFDGNVN